MHSSCAASARKSRRRPDRFIVDGLRTSLGLQKVSIRGISPNTHFAKVMVEADYRMKLIGIGLERPPIQLTSYVDRASPSTVGRNAFNYLFARLPLRAQRPGSRGDGAGRRWRQARGGR